MVSTTQELQPDKKNQDEYQQQKKDPNRNQSEDMKRKNPNSLPTRKQDKGSQQEDKNRQHMLTE